MKFYNMNKENNQNEDTEARVEIFDPFLIVYEKIKTLSLNPLQSDQALLYAIIFGNCYSKSSNFVKKLHENHDTEISSVILLTRFLIFFPIIPILIAIYNICNSLMDYYENLEDDWLDQLSPNKVS